MSAQIRDAPSAAAGGDRAPGWPDGEDRRRWSGTDPAALGIGPAPPAAGSPALILLLSLVAVAVVFLLDHLSGPDIGLSLLYLGPVVYCGGWAGRRAGIVAAVAATVAWFVADVIQFDHSVAVSLWNGFTRMVIYTAMAWMTWRIRADREEFAALARNQAALARTDSVTGLPNSLAFRERLARLATEPAGGAGPLLLAYVDVDNFKQVNDRYGHARGDEVLGRLAVALRSALRGGDMAARLGGDEFALVVVGLPREAVEPLAGRLIGQVAAIARDNPGCGLGLSIGAVWLERPLLAPDDALRAADRAMYEAKAAGKNRVVIRPGGEAMASQPADP